MKYQQHSASSAARDKNASTVEPLFIEGLEARQLLSTSILKSFKGTKFRPGSDARPSVASSLTGNGKAADATAGKKAKPTYHTNYIVTRKSTAKPFGSTAPQYLTPSQIRSFYNVNNISFSGVTGDGSGQTIAIIDAYDDPRLSSSNTSGYATSDLFNFSNYFGLQQFGGTGPTFTKVNQSGGTSYPAADAGWIGEIALDVEWAHVMAPKANIILVEGNDDAAGIDSAINYARSLSSVSVISMSFGSDEYSSETSDDTNLYATPTGHAGITFVASTGDDGANGSYPAYSPGVVAVGGTNVSLGAGSAYGSESGWSGSGGGISTIESKPAYQNLVTTPSTTYRTTPDVSIIGGTAVSVYDSYNNSTTGNGNGPWTGAYGTSLSAPVWSGLIAVTNQGRAINGQGALNGSSQTLPRLYTLPTSVYHDITSGNNGFAAGAGYDLVTGRGTPITNTLVPDLAGGIYTGKVFQDNNGDAAFNGTDSAISGRTVYNDTNNNGAFDSGESSAVTNASGVYSLDLVGGLTLHLRTATPTNYVPTSSILYNGTTAFGTFTNNFSYFPTTFNLSAGTNAVTLRLDSTATKFQIFINTATSGTPTYQIAKVSVSSLVFNGNTGDDTFTLDLTNGGTASGMNLTFAGGSQTTADKVVVIGNAAGSNAVFGNSNSVNIGNFSLSYSGVESEAYNGGAGNDSLTLLGIDSPVFKGNGGNDAVAVFFGTYAPTADLGADGTAVALSTTGGTSSITLSTSQHLASLALGGSSTVVLSGASKVIRTSALSINSTSSLDLNSNGLVLDYSGSSPNAAVAAVAALLATGYAAGAWNGVGGIRSSTAAADGNKQHALGAGEASDVLGLSGAATASFLGETVDATTLLVRYTVYGDANLDAKVDFNDFLALQANFGQATNNFGRGNFNYDATTDFNDFLSLQADFGLIA